MLSPEAAEMRQKLRGLVKDVFEAELMEKSVANLVISP